MPAVGPSVALPATRRAPVHLYLPDACRVFSLLVAAGNRGIEAGWLLLPWSVPRGVAAQESNSPLVLLYRANRTALLWRLVGCLAGCCVGLDRELLLPPFSTIPTSPPSPPPVRVAYLAFSDVCVFLLVLYCLWIFCFSGGVQCLCHAADTGVLLTV